MIRYHLKAIINIIFERLVCRFKGHDYCKCKLCDGFTYCKRCRG